MYTISLDKRNNHASHLKWKFESELIMNISCRPRVFDTQSQDIIARILKKKTFDIYEYPWVQTMIIQSNKHFPRFLL